MKYSLMEDTLHINKSNGFYITIERIDPYRETEHLKVWLASDGNNKKGVRVLKKNLGLVILGPLRKLVGKRHLRSIIIHFP